MTNADYNWDIRDAGGTPLDPEALKGEVIFLNFWGTYCPPCIAEMPEIQAIYNDYKDKVKFILVSAEDPVKVDGFLNRHGFLLPSYYGGRSMPQVFSVRSIPTTFIISKEGRVVNKKVGAADWNSKATRKVFDELLK
jgi:thiol-disulfide isomerase/thioredoxin